MKVEAKDNDPYNLEISLGCAIFSDCHWQAIITFNNTTEYVVLALLPDQTPQLSKGPTYSQLA
jgi:hypothetical protein